MGMFTSVLAIDSSVFAPFKSPTRDAAGLDECWLLADVNGL
jgi:hypothetical protein